MNRRNSIEYSKRADKQWYRKAFRRGYAPAANNIGVLCRDEGKTNLAMEWFQRAVRLKDLDAALELTKIYLKRDESARALHYLKLASKAKSECITEASRDEAKRLLNSLHY